MDNVTHPHSVEQFKENLAAVEERMANAAQRAGRNPDDVRLIAVSKTYPIDVVRIAIEAGMTTLGENRPQELEEKAQTLNPEFPGLDWCAIGHLQRNKAKDVAAYASEFHALDSLRLANALEKRLADNGRTLDVFVQVNTSHEEQKGGFAPDEVQAFLPELAKLPHLKPRGLMTMAAFSTDEAQVRGSFAQLRELSQSLAGNLPDNFGPFNELSMGMSGDFEWAIEEGATTVRVGTALFGHRANSAYLTRENSH